MKKAIIALAVLLCVGCEQPTEQNSTAKQITPTAKQSAEQSEKEILAAENTAENVQLEQNNNDADNQKQQVSEQESPEQTNQSDGKYQTVEWIELMPEEDLIALLNPPEYLNDIADGSMEDQLANTMKSAMDGEQQAPDRYQQALMSTQVIEEMNGKNIRIPGFVVPVEFSGEQMVTSFFLVPFFGACIHSPPPPPNQIIYVETTEAFKLENLYDPVYISGKLSAEMFEDQLATSAYTMKMDIVEPFE